MYLYHTSKQDVTRTERAQANPSAVTKSLGMRMIADAIWIGKAHGLIGHLGLALLAVLKAGDIYSTATKFLLKNYPTFNVREWT